MDDNDPFLSLNNSGATNLTLGNNEVQEVSVTTNGYSGEYGTLAGANVAFVTKSGTNQWHGKDILLLERPRARTRTAGSTTLRGVPRSFVNANQWGADIGGPIVKNKVFGYFNTEGLYLFIPAGGSTISIPSPQFCGRHPGYHQFHLRRQLTHGHLLQLYPFALRWDSGRTRQSSCTLNHCESDHRHASRRRMRYLGGGY